MTFEVFVSYSTKDAKAANATCAALEGAEIRCWMAPRDIVAGAQWGASIVRAINQCQVMVLIFSGNANGSAQVHREVDQAFSKGKVVVPLRIEDVLPADELAYYLNTVHWLDALTLPLEKSLAQLITTVRALLEAPRQTLEATELSSDVEAARAQDVARAKDEQVERKERGEPKTDDNGDFQSGSPEQRSRRLLLGASLTGLAIIGCGGLWLVERTAVSTAPTPLTVLLRRDASSQPAFQLTINARDRKLTVDRLGADALEPGRTYELWIVSGHGPTAVGIIGSEKLTQMPVPADYDFNTLRAAIYAVSNEPTNGSPRTLPSGPVMFTGRVTGET